MWKLSNQTWVLSNHMRMLSKQMRMLSKRMMIGGYPKNLTRGKEKAFFPLCQRNGIFIDKVYFSEGLRILILEARGGVGFKFGNLANLVTV
jgi:hypothetical protein